MPLFDDMFGGAAQADIVRVFGETVTIQRVTETPDAYGSQTEEWNNLIASLDCHFYALSGSEVERLERLEVEANYALSCVAPDETITEKDRVVKDGTVYDITWVQPMTPGGTILRLALRQRG